MVATVKCERCGNKEYWQEGYKLMEASGPDAVVTLKLKGARGNLIANVCKNCAEGMEKLGWKRSNL